MTVRQCACGFTEAASADETVEDHLLEVFTPPGCRGNDRLLHEEALPSLTCLCGLVAATIREMDAHFLQVFTPADRIGRDGVVHKAVG